MAGGGASDSGIRAWWQRTRSWYSERPLCTRIRGWWKRARHSEWRLSTNIIGLLMIFLSVATGVQGYILDSRTQQVAACVSAYADGFADAIEARSNANRESQDALDELMVTVGAVLTRTADRDRLVLAVQDYLRKRVEAKTTQARNPFPAAPRDACEEP